MNDLRSLLKGFFCTFKTQNIKLGNCNKYFDLLFKNVSNLKFLNFYFIQLCKYCFYFFATLLRYLLSIWGKENIIKAEIIKFSQLILKVQWCN